MKKNRDLENNKPVSFSDLANQFDTKEDKPRLGNVGKSAIFQVNVSVLVSETKEGLDELLKILEDYCEVNHLLVKTKKTKCIMIFDKTGSL